MIYHVMSHVIYIFSFSYKYIVGSVLSSTETRHIEYKTGGYAIKNLDLVINCYKTN